MQLQKQAFYVGYECANGLICLYQEISPAPLPFPSQEDAKVFAARLSEDSVPKMFANGAKTDWQVYRMTLEPVGPKGPHRSLEEALEARRG